MWLNLRQVHLHDAGLNALLESAYAQLREAMPGFEPSALKVAELRPGDNSPHRAPRR